MPGEHMHGIVTVRCSIWLPLIVVITYLLSFMRWFYTHPLSLQVGLYTEVFFDS